MINPFDILLWSLLVGPTATGIITVIRVLPFIKKAMMELKKPWVCDVCMSFWVTGFVGAVLATWKQDPLFLVVCGPAYPWTMWTLRKITDPIGPPPLPLEDSSDG